MANDLQILTDKLLARGLLTLRENAIMPRLVYRDLGSEAMGKGTTIQVPIPAAQTVSDVAPSAAPIQGTDKSIRYKSIQLDQWKKTDFYLTDKEMAETLANDRFIPMQAAEAVKVIGNHIDERLLGHASEFYGFVGTPDTTPFGTGRETKDAIDVTATLTKQLAPKQERFCVVNVDAAASAMGVRAFQDISWTGNANVMDNAEMRYKLGLQWFEDQNVQSHTAGAKVTGTETGTNYQHWAVNNSGGYATAAKQNDGESTIAIDKVTGGSGVTIADPVAGDIFTFAGSTQTYVVVSFSSNSLTFAPELKSDIADNAKLTFKGNHVNNFAFTRNAIALVTRPLAPQPNVGNTIQSTMTDEETGLSMRLEVTRQNKQLLFEFDILFGSGVLRRELGCRLAG